MGNSEVGHLNLGAGSVVRQDLTRINDAVLDGVLSENPAIVHALTCSERVHLIGLVSDGGVHSSLGHLQALLELAGRLSVRELVVHCFTDGRDTLPESGVEHVGLLEHWCRELWPPRTRGAARVGSVIGRWYAMDRDRRWERIQAAYDLLVHGRAPHHEESGVEAVRGAYDRGETDEFIVPTTVGEEGLIRPWDSVLCFNFRPDRVRELTRALAEPGFGDTPTRGEPPAGGGPLTGGDLPAGGVSPSEGDPPVEAFPGWEGRRGIEPVEQYTTLTEYEEGWPYPIAFPPQRPVATLAGVLAAAGAPQLHVAETEKYAHVTYFFNGGEEVPHGGERRLLAPSPRDVPTYDLEPEMSARKVTDLFLEAWRERREGGFRFAVLNFANPDMVGHTGVIPAAVRAIETVDGCLRRGRSRGARLRRRLSGHRRPRQRRAHARARRLPQHRPHLQPRAPDRHPPRPAAPAGRGHPRGRRSHRPRAARHPPARGDVRALADARVRGDMMARVGTMALGGAMARGSRGAGSEHVNEVQEAS